MIEKFDEFLNEHTNTDMRNYIKYLKTIEFDEDTKITFEFYGKIIEIGNSETINNLIEYLNDEIDLNNDMGIIE